MSIRLIDNFNYLFYHYFDITDIYNLLLVNTSTNKSYQDPFIWKALFNRDYLEITKGKLLDLGNTVSPSKKYYYCYQLYYNAKYLCSVCLKPLLDNNYYMLLCNCLEIKNYLYAHTNCIQATKKKCSCLCQYQCHYCHTCKMALPLKM